VADEGATRGGPATPGTGATTIVVGAGVAGLACASALHDLGQHVVVLEATDRVGGRIKTDRHPDGYLIDHGFQVLLDAYPAARRWVTRDALRTQPFDAGAHVWTGRRLVPLANPLAHPDGIVRDVTSRLFGFSDKVRLAELGWRAMTAPWESAREASSMAEDVSAEEYLWNAGFSRKFVDRFARPFWGGITLDPSLRQSAGPMLFTLKMFLAGRAVLPAAGVGALPEAMAANLPDDALRFNATVDRLVIEDGRVVGVSLNGVRLHADAVVVATDPPAARSLTGIAALPAAAEGLRSLTVFLAGERDPGIGPRLVVNGSTDRVVNHLAPLSAAQPTYAPVGKHLIAAVVVGANLERPVDDLVHAAHLEAAEMLGQNRGDWEVVAIKDVPFSQFAQAPVRYRTLPGNATEIAGLYLASEATVDSSYNGAILSGEAAARLVVSDRATAARTR